MLTCEKDFWNLAHKSKFQKMENHFQRELIQEIVIIDINQFTKPLAKLVYKTLIKMNLTETVK